MCSGHAVSISQRGIDSGEAEKTGEQRVGKEERVMSAHLVDGKRIRRLRASRQWSQADLSKASGVDQGVISRMENNQQKHTRIGTIAALARALGVPTDSLLTSSAPVPTEPVDPQAIRLIHLFRQMTPEERQWAELYARFIIAHRNSTKPSGSPLPTKV